MNDAPPTDKATNRCLVCQKDRDSHVGDRDCVLFPNYNSAVWIVPEINGRPAVIYKSRLEALLSADHTKYEDEMHGVI